MYRNNTSYKNPTDRRWVNHPVHTHTHIYKYKYNYFWTRYDDSFYARWNKQVSCNPPCNVDAAEKTNAIRTLCGTHETRRLLLFEYTAKGFIKINLTVKWCSCCATIIGWNIHDEIVFGLFVLLTCDDFDFLRVPVFTSTTRESRRKQAVSCSRNTIHLQRIERRKRPEKRVENIIHETHI